MEAGELNSDSSVVDLPEAPQTPLNPHPKVIVVDVPEVADPLRSAGFNVSVGSFGTVRWVNKSDSLVAVDPDWILPNAEEQEILIIDTMDPDPHPPSSSEELVYGENRYWVSAITGIMTPRSLAMSLFRTKFDNILRHGGIFVVFASPRVNQSYLYGHYTRSKRFETQRSVQVNNWAFLSSMDYMIVEDQAGNEMKVISDHDTFGRLLDKYVLDAEFTTTIRPDTRWLARVNWKPLLHNKYGASVGGILVEENRTVGRINRGGMVVVLPRIARRGDLVTRLLSECLPRIYPQLFPADESASWINQDDYRLPTIGRLTLNKVEVCKRYIEDVRKIDELIEDEVIAYGDLYRVLSDTGSSLVDAVRSIFNRLGFNFVVDADAEVDNRRTGTQRDEDLRICDHSPILLVEVKGINGMPRDEDCLAVMKYVAPRMRELNRTDIQGLTIVNHQRHLPPLNRANAQVFRDTVIDMARSHEIGLITTWDLHRLTRGFIENGWTHEDVKDLFYAAGRIDPIPSHYSYVGFVDGFIRRLSVVGIEVEAQALRQGDRIAFELPATFIEQDVVSLEVENLPVESALPTQKAGIRTEFNQSQLQDRTRVYRVHRSDE